MHPQHHVLQLDIQGTPQAWITQEHAALHVAAGAVAWFDGAGPLATLRGGFNLARKRRSLIEVYPIIALTGAARVNLFDNPPVSMERFVRFNAARGVYGDTDVEESVRETLAWARDGKASPAGNARKCHFCIHRLEAGMLPACVTTCIGYATFFGDMNDPESLIHELAGEPNEMRLKEELGTKPRVFYLT